VPKWRANRVAAYRPDDLWSFTGGLRCRGMQYRLAQQRTMRAGIDNLGDQTCRAFHPYPQRTLSAELRCDF
jgi:iron complex outermembrane recepter protein